jgi:hypothetical protein
LLFVPWQVVAAVSNGENTVSELTNPVQDGCRPRGGGEDSQPEAREDSQPEAAEEDSQPEAAEDCAESSGPQAVGN